MGREYFLISDTHFSHKNVLTFLRADGTPLRVFSSVEDMDEFMIERWNSVVKPGDYVYHLGDVTFNYDKFDEIAPRLTGQKRLILGNHDRIKKTTLMSHFKKVELWKRFDSHKIICTHLPASIDTLTAEKYTHNVHGHIHSRTLKSELHACVCVEQINYTPVNLDEVSKYFGR